MELKQRMTFEEMSQHMQLSSFKFPSRVNVGRYAKSIGYKVYKPMVNRKVLFFYVKDEQSPLGVKKVR